MVSVQRIAALSLTLVVVAVVLFSGPAQAITLGVTLSASTTDEEETTYFDVVVDIHDVDILNKDAAFTVELDEQDGSGFFSCTFNMSGNNLSACEDLSVALYSSDLGSYSEGYGYLYGYGYGPSGYVINGTNFSAATGFGYGYSPGAGFSSYTGSVGSSGELVYRVYWAAPSVAADKYYDIDFFVNVTDGVTNKSYKTLDSNDAVIRVNEVEEDSSSSSSSSSASDDSVIPAESNDDVVHDPVVTRVFSSLSADQEVSFTVDDDDIPFTFISFTARSDTDAVTLSVARRLNPPVAWKSSLEEDPFLHVFAFAEVEHGGLLTENLDGAAELRFTVPDSWLQSEGVEADDIRFYTRESGSWVQYPVSRSSSEYTVSVPELGYFAIAGPSLLVRAGATVEDEKEVREVEVYPVDDDVLAQNSTGTVEDPTIADDVGDEKRPGLLVLVFVIAVTVLLGIFTGVSFHYLRRKK